MAHFGETFSLGDTRLLRTHSSLLRPGAWPRGAQCFASEDGSHSSSEETAKTEETLTGEREERGQRKRMLS